MTREEVFEGLAKRGDSFVKKADDSYIRVMTSNILCPRGAYETGYLERADILTGMYLYYQPDFLGLQEMIPEMRAAFEDRFSDVYAFVDTPTGEKLKADGWHVYNNYTPLVYNKHLFEVVESRYHAFVEKSAFSYHWAMYKDRRDPSKRYIHMNLHYYYQCDERQLPGFLDVHNELVHLRRHYPRIPIFVTGDYNCCRHQPNFEVMVDGLRMESGVMIAEDAEPNANDYWCHVLGSTELQHCGTAIDHITVTTDLCRVKLHRVLHDELLCKSSDHCARFLDIEIKEKEML